MASAINKRQQIRNERTLEQLIKTVPGNDRCADCAARNPGWASWSLGVFLCMRCAALHRKLGTHLSKVKSLSMDAWTTEQVENMKRTGNTASNHVYNPRNVKPAIPIDVDEVDGVMERFIRQKYDSKTLSSESQPASRQHTGSTGSSDDRISAPLPPKPTKRFTFSLRSSSSAFPSTRSERSPPLSPGLNGFGPGARRPSPSGKKTKPSKIFGTDIGGSRQDNYELKLIALREMGFPDDKRNLQILKGEGGNVDRAAATLLRLGESNSRLSSGRSSPAPETPPKDDHQFNPQTSKQANPFDRLDLQEKALPPPPVEDTPQRPHTSLANSNAYNPFVSPTQPTLEQSFQGLNVAQPSHLFPNTTGGYSVSQPQITTNPFLQTYTPPPQPQVTTNRVHPIISPAPFAPPLQTLDQFQSAASGANPFLSISPQNQYQVSNPFETQQNQYSNPQNASEPMGFGAHQTFNSNISMNSYNAMPHVVQQSPFAPQNNPAPFYSQTPQHISPQSNPFLMSAPSHTNSLAVPAQFTQDSAVQSPLAHSTAQNPYHGNPFETQQFPTYQHSQTIPVPARIDKASILALYNLPSNPSQPIAATSSTMNIQSQASAGAKRSVTMPVPSTTQQTTPTAPALNPFGAVSSNNVSTSEVGSSGGITQKAGFSSAFAHISHDSVDFSTMLNGRHSPDAFAGLSARIAR